MIKIFVLSTTKWYHCSTIPFVVSEAICDLLCCVLNFILSLLLFLSKVELLNNGVMREKWPIRGICLFGLVSLGGRISPPSPVSDLSYLFRWKSDRTFCQDEILPKSVWSVTAVLTSPPLPCCPPWWRCRHSGCLSSWPPPSLWSTWPSPLSSPFRHLINI